MKAALTMPVSEFCHSVKTNRVFPALEQGVLATFGHRVAPNERSSWQGSVPRLSGAIELAGLPDSTFIGLEVTIPYYSERIDAVLYGHDGSGRAFALLVELKQWSEVREIDDETRVGVRMGSGLVKALHPSLQVDGYRRHLANFVRAFHNEPPVRIDCAVYAHNYPARDGALFDPRFAEAIARAPVFCADDAEALADFMRTRLGDDRGAEIVDRVRSEGFAPSRLLMDRASEAIARQDVFVMLDDQIAAQHDIRRSLNEAIGREDRSIILIEGGPGTGKSVIALDALGHALRKNQRAHLVSGSAAYTHSMRRLLGPDLACCVKFTDQFWDAPEGAADVLIVDEAHRIRAKSEPKVVAARRPKISQLEELVRAAKVTVLFMDVNQIIQPDEQGDPEKVRDLARRLRVPLKEHRLRAQFRCGGSDDYLAWADALFDLADGVEPHRLASPGTIDVDVMGSPHEVLSWVRSKNAADPNSARLVAGWCWPWSDPGPDGTLVNDIVIGDFTFPWELKNGKRGKKGIPEAKHWAVDPAGADQAGTVYSVQGFEFRNVGLLMGPDLVIRDGRWVANPRANHAPKLRAKPAEVASVYLRRIYRTLFTRPRQALRVFSVDQETQTFLRSLIERTPSLPALSRVIPFRRLAGAQPAPGEVPVPLHRIKIAAGRPDQLQYEETPEWVVVTAATRRVEQGMVVAQIEGDSMAPLVLPGQYALFAPVIAGDDGMIVLAQLRKRHETKEGGRFLLKRLRKGAGGEVVLESLNKAYDPIIVGADDELRVVARFVEALGG